MTLYEGLNLGLGGGIVVAVFIVVWRIGAWTAKNDARYEAYAAKSENRHKSVVGALRAIVSTINDEGERRVIEAQILVLNSPPRLNYPLLRKLVEERGRPPQHVIDAIVRIAGDATLAEDWQILGAIYEAFTDEQMRRAWETHGGDAASANRVFLQVVAECRELGTEKVLRALGLMDEEGQA